MKTITYSKRKIGCGSNECGDSFESSVYDDDYAFFILSGGKGKYGRISANITATKCKEYAQKAPRKFFDEKIKSDYSFNMICHIQEELMRKSKEMKANFDEMKANLVFLAISRKDSKYTAVHIGDGVIAKRNGNKYEALSLPHTRINPAETFFVNTDDCKNIRIKAGDVYSNDEFFIGSKGIYEDDRVCLKNIFDDNFLQRLLSRFQDDATFFKVIID